MNLARFPRRRYTSGFTPIESLDRLSKELGGPRIFIKRDDLLGGAGGGYQGATCTVESRSYSASSGHPGL